MDLKIATGGVIKKDSVAAIKSEGMIGDKFVEISFGSKDAPKVRNGDTIQSQPPIQISDLLQKTDGILDSAKDTMQSVGDTADNLESITSKINHGNGTVGSLINNKTMYQHVNQAATSFEEDAEALKHNFLLRGFFKKRGYEDTQELAKHAISQLPSGPVNRKFAFDGSKLFDKPDSAKLKNEHALNKAGEFLENNSFGLAVVSASTDMKGDTDKDRVLTEARAMVIRGYLVDNFKFDDNLLKTIGMGKSAEVKEGSAIDILIYPPRAR
jgi:outer membrane protein OmpA-like peptidoglycan-associated protein